VRKDQLEVVLRLRDQLSAALRSAVGNVGSAAKGISSSMGAMASSIKSAFLNLPTLIGAIVAALGIRKLIQEIQGVVSQAVQAENAMVELANAMRIAGSFTRDALEASLAYSDALAGATGVSDELITSVQAMLTQFGIQEELVKRTTAAVLDWSKISGKDAKSAALDFIRANEGFIVGFKRSGLAIDEAAFKSGIDAAVADEYHSAADAWRARNAVHMRAVTGNALPDLCACLPV